MASSVDFPADSKAVSSFPMSSRYSRVLSDKSKNALTAPIAAAPIAAIATAAAFPVPFNFSIEPSKASALSDAFFVFSAASSVSLLKSSRAFSLFPSSPFSLSSCLLSRSICLFTPSTARSISSLLAPSSFIFSMIRCFSATRAPIFFCWMPI